MTQRDFDRLTRELFSQTLARFGFTSPGPRRPSFFRKTNEDVYHFVSPIRGQSGTWFYIRVFPHSPRIDPRFHDEFPDELGVPTDSWSCLSEHDGVNLTQQHFNCKTEENFRRRYASTIEPLLLKVAVPYLDRFQTVADLIPAIRHSSFLGFALHYVGRTAEARIALQAESDRLRRLPNQDRRVRKLLEEVELLLNSAGN